MKLDDTEITKEKLLKVIWGNLSNNAKKDIVMAYYKEHAQHAYIHGRYKDKWS